MNKLIKLQLRNVFHNKLFYVCLGLMLASTSLLKFLTSSNMQTIKVFPEIINFLSSEVGIISTIFIALFCCFDFNEGTTKNIISRGYNRNQFLFSKYIVSLLS